MSRGWRERNDSEFRTETGLDIQYAATPAVDVGSVMLWSNGETTNESIEKFLDS